MLSFGSEHRGQACLLKGFQGLVVIGSIMEFLFLDSKIAVIVAVLVGLVALMFVVPFSIWWSNNYEKVDAPPIQELHSAMEASATVKLRDSSVEFEARSELTIKR